MIDFQPGDIVKYDLGDDVAAGTVKEVREGTYATEVWYVEGGFDLARNLVLAERAKPAGSTIQDLINMAKPDMVNHPPHYKFDDGVEVIDLTEQLNFNSGNAVKYIARAGRKADDPVQDLEKAAWYVAKELERVKRRSSVH